MLLLILFDVKCVAAVTELFVVGLLLRALSRIQRRLVILYFVHNIGLAENYSVRHWSCPSSVPFSNMDFKNEPLEGKQQE